MKGRSGDDGRFSEGLYEVYDPAAYVDGRGESGFIPEVVPKSTGGLKGGDMR